MECYNVIMRHQQFVLPMQCKRCGATFDLWHDLLDKEKISENEAFELGEIKEHFCWKCRKVVTGDMGFVSFEDDIQVSQEEQDFDLHWN